MKKKKRPSNVRIPGLADMEPTPDMPADHVEILRLFQKLEADPESLDEQEYEQFREITRQLAHQQVLETDPKERESAIAAGERAWDLLGAGKVEEALEVAEKGLRHNSMEPRCMYVQACGMENNQEAFEAMAAVAAQVEFDLLAEKNAMRVAMLNRIHDLSRLNAGVAAFSCGHFESAVGPLIELLESGHGEVGGAEPFLGAAFLALGEAEDALAVFDELASHEPVFQWGRVLALMLLKRDHEASDAAKEATRTAPKVLNLLNEPMQRADLMSAMAENDRHAFAAHLLAVALKKQRSLAKKVKALAA